MIKITTEDVSHQYLSNATRLSNLAAVDQFIAGQHIRIRYCHWENSAYSNTTYSGTYEICIGPIYPKFFPNIKYELFTDVEEDLPRQDLFYHGINYHELGHILWSPFNYFFNKIEDYRVSLKMFVKEFFNVLEDTFIEDHMMFSYPETKEPIMFVRTYFDNSNLLNDVTEQIKANPKSGSTFINYLLLRCRSNQEVPPYEIWDNNKKFFDKALQQIYLSLSNKERTDRCIALAVAVAKLLTTDEELPKEPPTDPGNPINVDGPDTPNGKLVTGPTSGSHARFKPIHDDTSSTEGPLPEEEETNKEDKEDLKALQNDAKFGLGYPHKWIHDVSVNLKEDRYPVVMGECSSIIGPTLSKMRKIKSRVPSEIQHFTSSGDVDIATAHIPFNPNPFCSKLVYAEALNAILYIVFDLSGSMGRTKCEYVGKAGLTIATCCDKIGIPFGMFGFTESSCVCETLVLKDPKESYRLKRDNLIMVHDRLYPSGDVDCWSGNIDEVNIANICERLLKEPQTEKFLIVLSDGETCGDATVLHNVIQYYDKRGITTLGIGVRTDEVDKIYNNHVTFDTDDDLKLLPEFLGKYLVNNMLVKKGNK